MVITTASKLMIAEDEISDLQKELELMHSAYDILSKAFSDSHKLAEKLQENNEALLKELNALKYDQSNPWWKFW